MPDWKQQLNIQRYFKVYSVTAQSDANLIYSLDACSKSRMITGHPERGKRPPGQDTLGLGFDAE